MLRRLNKTDRAIMGAVGLGVVRRGDGGGWLLGERDFTYTIAWMTGEGLVTHTNYWGLALTALGLEALNESLPDETVR